MQVSYTNVQLTLRYLFAAQEGYTQISLRGFPKAKKKNSFR